MEDNVVFSEDSYSWCETDNDWIEWYLLEQMEIEAEVYED